MFGSRRIILSLGGVIAAGIIRLPQNGKADKTTNQYHIWGNGFYQSMSMQGTSGTSFANFTPKKIDIADPQITQLFLGEYFEGGITNAGEVWVWDTHRLSSCMNASVDDSARQNLTKLVVPAPVKDVRMTKGFLWVLTSKGDVFQYPLERKINKETQEVESVQLSQKSRKVQSLNKIKQIDCGEDHFIALDESGRVFSMGDDTQGQCGLGSNKRSTAPPFYEQRIRSPQQINTLPTIKIIRCGGNHTIALGVEGSVYVWGSNSKMQLSQQQEYSRVDQPLIAVYSPIRISQNMEQNNRVVDAAAGEEFSVFVTENHSSGETEVFGCGHNLKGELGASFVRHLSDIVKIEALSNYRIKTPNGEQNVKVKQIACGRNHCMALLSIGAILEWGDNEYGQMGNKKRSTADSPIIMNTFSKENVVSIACGNYQSGVIVQK